MKTSVGELIKRGNMELLAELHNRDFDLNAPGPDGLLPIHIAAKEGKEDAVLFLLSYGADIDAGSPDNKTALCIAAEEGHLAVVKLLLQFKPDVNNEGNKKALYAVVFPKSKIENDEEGYNKPVFIPFGERKRMVSNILNKNKLIFETLLEHGFMYELAPGCDPKFFHGLVEHDFFEMVEDLLLYGADANVDYSGQTALLLTIKKERTDMAELLLSYGADVNAQDEDKRTAIYYAANSGNAKLFNILITHGATITDFPCVVHAAISGKSLEIVEKLLKLGNVDVNDCYDDDMPALLYSLQRGCGEITALLLDKGADVNEECEECPDTPLHLACSDGNLEICETMLKNGAHVNAKNGEDHTPLHKANSPELIKMLVQFGADVNIRDYFDQTPLHTTCHADIAKALIECGAVVNVRNRKSVTPLHIASRDEDEDYVEELLANGANIDSTDFEGRTALHIAWKAGNYLVVRLLLDCGADINICDKKNRTPLDCVLSSLNPRNYNKMQLFLHFVSHIIRRQTIGMFVSERNLQGMRIILGVINKKEEDFSKVHRPLFEEEIGKLDALKIGNLNISYYKLLRTNTNSFAMLLRNDNVLQAFQADVVRADEFSYYAGLLKGKFWRAMERKRSFEESCEMFDYLCRELPRLPACCVDAIFQYLSNEDLQMVVEACKASKQSQLVTLSDDGEYGDSSNEWGDISDIWGDGSDEFGDSCDDFADSCDEFDNSCEEEDTESVFNSSLFASNSDDSDG